MLDRIIVKSSHPKRFENLLERCINSSTNHQNIIIQGLNDALPKNGRGTLSLVMLVRFDEKPQALETLEKTFAQSDAMKKTLTWLTRPGEAR